MCEPNIIIGPQKNRVPTVIITAIDEFQQLNLFVFELLFYVIRDMSLNL